MSDTPTPPADETSEDEQTEAAEPVTVSQIQGDGKRKEVEVTPEDGDQRTATPAPEPVKPDTQIAGEGDNAGKRVPMSELGVDQPDDESPEDPAHEEDTNPVPQGAEGVGVGNGGVSTAAIAGGLTAENDPRDGHTEDTDALAQGATGVGVGQGGLPDSGPTADAQAAGQGEGEQPEE